VHARASEHVHVSEQPDHSIMVIRSQLQSAVLEPTRRHHKVKCTTKRATIRANKQPSLGNAHRQSTTSPPKQITQPHNIHPPLSVVSPSSPQTGTSPKLRNIPTSKLEPSLLPPFSSTDGWKFWIVSRCPTTTRRTSNDQSTPSHPPVRPKRPARTEMRFESLMG
jgi:hypothetical protein